MSAQLTYCNPFWPQAFPDPFVLKVRGRYYAYATEPMMRPADGSWVFPILRSDDLVHWNEAGKAFPAFGAPYYHYWAPEVTVYNDQFLLYYAVHTEEFKGGIRVAVADSPEGPFTDSGHDLTAAYLPWAIDPHVFRDQDGQYYLYMTIDYWNDPITGFTGSGNAVARLLDPFTLQGQVTRVTPPSRSWQLFEAKREEKGGIDWYTVEGPSVMRHRKRYYELFSGGCYYRDNYAMSYATSNVPLGPDGMRDTSWHDQIGADGQPFLIHGDGEHVISPGHNSVVLGPNNVDQYLVYHILQKDTHERHPSMDRLFWHGEEIWTPAPTYLPQPVPAMPRIRELFEDAMLSDRWQVQNGNWHIGGGAVIQDDAALAQASLHRQERLDANWLLEVNLRALAENGAPDSAYGIALHGDTGSVLHVVLTSDARLLITSPELQPRLLHTLTLPPDTRTQAWHQLLLSCSGSVLSIQLDGLPLLVTQLEDACSTFSLLTASCQAAFSGISLTDHYRDEFLDPSHTLPLLGWWSGESESGEASGGWRIQNDRLEQIGLEQGVHTLLKGSPYRAYEFGATLRLQSVNEREEAGLGCVLAQDGAAKTFVWLTQHAGQWRLSVEAPTSPADETAMTLDLPAPFNPFDWHTLHLARRSDQLAIYLDGTSTLSLPLQMRQETVGLATRHASAAFMSVWQTS